MSDDKDKKDKKSSGLKGGDVRLWQTATRDVKRLPGKRYQEPKPQEEPEKPRRTESPPVRAAAPKPPGSSRRTKDEKTGPGLDRGTDERLRRGQMEIEARLDLHGLSQKDAQDKLNRFLPNCYESGKRCVLVITGKGGLTEPGVLRRNVPLWLREGKLARIVLQFHPARPKDGGTGALYVLLRRKRD